VPHIVRVSTPAAKALNRLSKQLQQRISDRIDELATNPRPADSKVVGGHRGRLRVRVGDYRIVYEFEEPPVGSVNIIRIGHRSDIYRRLP
jgi:mRNA interferase RelE/StbE